MISNYYQEKWRQVKAIQVAKSLGGCIHGMLKRFSLRPIAHPTFWPSQEAEGRKGIFLPNGERVWGQEGKKPEILKSKRLLASATTS